jgi:hypothetical protein
LDKGVQHNLHNHTIHPHMLYLLDTPHNIHWRTSPGALAHHMLGEQKYQMQGIQRMD